MQNIAVSKASTMLVSFLSSLCINLDRIREKGYGCIGLILMSFRFISGLEGAIVGVLSSVPFLYPEGIF